MLYLRNLPSEHVSWWHNYDKLLIYYNSFFCSFLMGIVQFTNYLRPVQFIVHVSVLNERLKLLDDKIIKIMTRSDRKRDAKMKFDDLSTSSLIFDAIEVYREAYGRIWRLHESLSHCFGFSILVITLNAFLSAAITLYFSVVLLSQAITVDFITQPLIHIFHISILFVVMIYSCECSNALVTKWNMRLDNSSIKYCRLRASIGTWIKSRKTFPICRLQNSHCK